MSGAVGIHISKPGIILHHKTWNKPQFTDYLSLEGDTFLGDWV
jgi:hypothetical protein